eukprot:gnl/MRDRNA2_/MRDRNA2_87145_c0_seq1.p1 gnl/MRDRNA2_/MRDRNA2_87145_c0~~gnl/MRDRNA2_/MRDRNA2_87145_c0_seq1.p1  ORF type:complete len:452 (+),score=121.92 gnl/MRDRNA2_/MRDRNA2_87145_c0_seq1:57-1412(+)
MPPSPGKDHVWPRGANDVLRVTTGAKRTYCPRAMWTQSEGHPLKGDVDEEDALEYYYGELQQEASKDARMRKYVKESLKKQLKEHSDLRAQAKMEVERQAAGMLKDVERYKVEEQKRKEKHKAKQAEEAALRESQVARARQERQSRLDDERKEAQEIRALGERMKREDARLQRKRKQDAQAEHNRTMQELKQAEDKRKADKMKEQEEMQKSHEEGMKEGEAREAARKQMLADFQKKTEINQDIYSATAGKFNHQREVRETQRLDKDERELDQRMSMLYDRRERLREAQRQDMVRCLAEQVREKSQQKQNELIQTQVEARALEEDARRSLEEDLRRYRQKKEDQKELQTELQKMMDDKMSRESGSIFSVLGNGKSGSLDQLSLATRMDASRFVQKPLGRIEVPKPPKRSHSTGKLAMTMGIMERDRRLEASPWRNSPKLRKSGSSQMLRTSS